MTRVVEAPSGGATLSVTGSDEDTGITSDVVYLRAANVVSEVTVPLLTTDLLAAIADELEVIVADRVDLPRVGTRHNGLPRAGYGADSIVASDAASILGTPERIRSVGLMYLALAEHYGAEPSGDEQQVEALAALLDDLGMSLREASDEHDAERIIARRLVARGVRVGGER